MGKVTNHLPEILTKYMKNEGISQVELAEKLGVSDGFLSRLRRRQSADSIRLEFLDKICDLLDLTPNDILWQEDPHETP